MGQGPGPRTKALDFCCLGCGYDCGAALPGTVWDILASSANPHLNPCFYLPCTPSSTQPWCKSRIWLLWGAVFQTYFSSYIKILKEKTKVDETTWLTLAKAASTHSSTISKGNQHRNKEEINKGSPSCSGVNRKKGLGGGRTIQIFPICI